MALIGSNTREETLSGLFLLLLFFLAAVDVTGSTNQGSAETQPIHGNR